MDTAVPARADAEVRPGIRLRPVSIADVPALQDICLRTGDCGRDATALTRFPELLADVYATPYAHHEAAFGTVVQDEGGVAGYVLGCLDSAEFERWRQAAWWPPLRRRYPRPEDVEEGFDSGPLRTVATGTGPDPVWATHPSHLHIDLLPRLQGGGIGRVLVERVCAQLAAAGSPGVHLGVSARNPGAVEFYRRTGFTELARTAGGHTFGRSLAPGSTAPASTVS
ncbi:GNAT family N-acetyltransferase [Kineococcus sp. SYSU DK003]|uniref:GNAT family N-acetyltransferase n=1 Tax=Kineococcus sp. SYSU DK003 TaxID=3383124 RepID=UPI003D7F0F47